MLLAGRLLASALFIVSGYFKFVLHDFNAGFFEKLGIPMPGITVYAAGAFELIAAAFLIIGFKTRPTVILLGLYSIVAASFAHTNFGDFNQLVHFLKNLTIIGGFLAFAVIGAGDYSVDGINQKRKDAAADANADVTA